METPNLPPSGSLREIASVFTRLGFTAFGGPAAHVAMMEDELVHRRKWIDRQHFLDLVAAINFIPGPNSTELAIHLGLIRGGFRGLLVAGFCFITPAVLIILPIAWLYVRYAGAGVTPPPAVLGVLQAIAGVVVAILAITAWRFAHTVARTPVAIAIGLLTLPADLLLRRYTDLQSEIVILAAAAVVGAITAGRRPPTFEPSSTDSATPSDPSAPASNPSASPAAPRTIAPAILPVGFAGVTSVIADGLRASRGSLAAMLATAAIPAEFLKLAWYFLTVGGTLFGSGYVLVNYLETGLVQQHGWLTHRQVVDAVAVGQVTPGPLLTTATFAGYLRGHAITGTELGGVVGAIVATVAIFLPAFVLVAVTGGVLQKLRRNRRARGALDSMNAAVVMLLAIVTVRFGLAAVAPDARLLVVPAVVALAALGLLVTGALSVTMLILCGAAAGFLIPAEG